MVVSVVGFLVDETEDLERRALTGASQSTGVLNSAFFFGKEGQVIISLPESCLLTTDTVIRSYLGAYIAK